ncbi:MAG TPA: hypothetical protein VFW19_02580 [Allosphingosinicella sp.]|nr:hypothetical protein [Allosphingosinicella sp.]
MVFAAAAARAEPASGPPPIAAPSISQDEAAIYEAVLDSWLGSEGGRHLVNEKLSAPPSIDDEEIRDCIKGLHFSAPAPGAPVQRSLAGIRFRRHGIVLVDGSQWKPADPGEAIAGGKSVDAAVRQGFANALTSFSQIAFGSDGKDALVRFSTVCGSLCGSGETIHLRRSAQGWAIVGRCGNWIS